MSAFFIFSQTSSVTRAPLVAMHIRRPSDVPYPASSKISLRSSGSPPERTTTGLEKSAISLSSFFPSSVVKSPSEESMSDEQRQWTHLRLHFCVVSQATHFGMNSWLNGALRFFGVNVREASLSIIDDGGRRR